MLRPTESGTLFLQQLGRGLRRAEGKADCTVLDFVGLHRREFRFDLRYRALLGGSRRDLEQQIGRSFPFLPAGCHFELDILSPATWSWRAYGTRFQRVGKSESRSCDRSAT